MNTSVGALKPNIVTTHLEANAHIKAANTSFSEAIDMVVMDLYEAKAQMRFNATVYLNELSVKAHTLIDTAASLNFVSKDFIMTYGFYTDCKTAPKLYIRVAIEHRISENNVFCPLVFTTDGHEFNDLQLRVTSSLLQKLGYHIGITSFEEVGCGYSPLFEYFCHGRLHNKFQS